MTTQAGLTQGYDDAGNLTLAYSADRVRASGVAGGWVYVAASVELDGYLRLSNIG